MGMAVQHSLHLRSLLQEMQLSQLAKPFELSVFTDSSSGKALASNFGLTKKIKHVQLGFVFMKDLRVHGQLHFRKIPAGKNPAPLLTKHPSASTLHKLLPKLGVRTRAADSKDLLSMLNVEMLASSRGGQSSFFIGMMAEQLDTAQLVAPSVASRLSPSSSFQQHSQEEVPTLHVVTANFLIEQLSVVLILPGSFALCWTSLQQTALSTSRSVAYCFPIALFSFALTQSLSSSSGLSEQL